MRIAARESDRSSTAEADASSGEWHDVAQLGEIPDVGGLLVSVNSKEIALFKDSGKVHAVDDECPHRGGSLSNGLAMDGEVTCPLHRWKFRLADGGCTTQPRASVGSYETRLEGDRVLLKL